MRTVAVALLLVGLGGCNAPPPPASDIAVHLEKLVDGLTLPVFATAEPDGAVYILEQEGVVKRLAPGDTVPSVVVDLRDRVGSGGERGLLGLAFPPDFAQSYRFFVHYTDLQGNTVLSRLGTNEHATEAFPKSEHVLLTQLQPQSNHNGGMIAFGRDGYLYMGLGDGGGAGDAHGPSGNAQNLGRILGKILRLDVSGEEATCPSTNPFHAAGQRCEVWDYGLRNPWRFSFDATTGDLWIGDVGQNRWEEVDFEPGARGGINYGWNVLEGRHSFRTGDTKGMVMPVAEYATGVDGTCAVTGGYVYRGSAIAALQGAYVFGDYCKGDLWTLTKSGSTWTRRTLLSTGFEISSFGEDSAHEILVCEHRGAVYRLVG